MLVVLGETGDTDYEEMLSGTHKTLIIKGVVEKGSGELIRSPGSYLMEDVVPSDNPLIASVNKGAKAEEISESLKQLSKAAL